VDEKELEVAGVDAGAVDEELKDEEGVNGAGAAAAGAGTGVGAAAAGGGVSSRAAPHSAQKRALAISSGSQRWPHSPQNMASLSMGDSGNETCEKGEVEIIQRSSRFDWDKLN
jgi:hypothetical protein